MKPGLVMTSDGELVGDGSGDYSRRQHAPAPALMGACEASVARLLFPAEIASTIRLSSSMADQRADEVSA